MSSDNNSLPVWMSAFQPFVEREFRVELKVPITMPAGRMIHDVAAVFLRFPMWTGAPFVDDLGKKSGGMIDLDGEHLFAELAVVRLLEKDGWSARWVNTSGAGKEVWKYLTEWKDVPREEQRNRIIEESEPRQLLARIAGFNKPRRYKGCWDVYGWRGDDIVFAECKRTTPKTTDVISADKHEWLRSTLYVGDRRATDKSFCFVQWDYA